LKKSKEIDMAGKFQLVMSSGPTPGKTFALSTDEAIVGRDAKNEVMINDSEISRQHFRLILQGNSYVIEDMGSTNGTYVNDTRITGQVALKMGDVIRAGDNVVVVFEVAEDPEATIASSGKAAPAPPPEPAQTPAAAPPPPIQQPQQTPQNYAGQVPLSPAPPADGKNPRRKLLLGCGGLLLIGGCITSLAFWYIDSNFLWCDVFGKLISACG
jgi:predicted component of type VI protein secretion system